MRNHFQRIAALSAVLLISPVIALSRDLEHLNGQILTSHGLCAVVAQKGNADIGADRDGMVLIGTGETAAFYPLGYPGICQIDGVLNPNMYGRGNDLPTAMVTVSCIDDTAVPVLGILALEYWPARTPDAARLVVSLVANEELEYLAGEYQGCTGAEGDILQQHFAG
ncbi:hypothetical protein FQV27_08940 [Paracoccus aurantiacus]|uniref:Uncharacterized protein n=1 Tax=Paracoccus aurantiacus TaxID=2599412 RepID=A0A5C6S3L9_9RHOB|nr:hypothetical protein [Paracoccus aurantiacus]TXB69089.1 hypothetical protein FQV27_08940 [Paracoccus aurantiacus]